MGQPLTKCPECSEKSILYVKQGNQQRAMPQIFFDEEGIKHVHDSTVNYTIFTCSNGHVTTKRSTGKCPSCDWEGPKFDEINQELPN